MNVKSPKAITLIEIIMSLLIFSVIGAGIYAAYSTGIRTWEYHNYNVTLQRNLLIGFETMVKELRVARNILITKEPKRVVLSFYRPSLGMVTYSWMSEGEQANQIIRQGPLKTKILAQNISSLSFTSIPSAVVIEITATTSSPKGEVLSCRLKEKVSLREKTGLIKDKNKVL